MRKLYMIPLVKSFLWALIVMGIGLFQVGVATYRSLLIERTFVQEEFFLSGILLITCVGAVCATFLLFYYSTAKGSNIRLATGGKVYLGGFILILFALACHLSLSISREPPEIGIFENVTFEHLTYFLLGASFFYAFTVKTIIMLSQLALKRPTTTTKP